MHYIEKVCMNLCEYHIYEELLTIVICLANLDENRVILLSI